MALLLKMDPSNIEAGAKRARAALDGVKQGASTAETAIDTLATRGAADMRNLATQSAQAGRATQQFARDVAVAGSGSRNMGFQVQNAAYQVGDFFVQVSGGTSALRAMSQQLPQLLGGFGILGAVIGGVVAAGAALVPMLFNTADASKEAADGVDLYGEALSALKSDISGAKALHAQYVEAVLQGNADLIRAIELEAKARQALFRVNELDLRGKQAAAAITLDIQRQATEGAMAEARAVAEKIRLENELMGITRAGREGPMTGTGTSTLLREQEQALAALQEQQSALDKTSAEYAVIEAQIGVINEQMKVNGDLIQITREGVVGTSDALDGSRINLQALVDLQTENVGRTSEATGEATHLGEALDAAQQFAAMIGANAPQGGFLSGAIADAGTLAATLWDAAAGAAAAALRESVAPLAGPAGMGSPPPTGGAVGTSPRPRRRGVDSATFGGSGGGGGGGGGGAAQVDRTREAYDRLMASLDPVIARTQDMAEATTVANAALAAGDISAAEHAKALELIAEKYGDVSDQMTILGEAGASAFDRMLEEGKLTGDMLKDLAKDIMFATVKAELLKHVTGGSSGMSIGSLLVAGITGGFHDGGGTIPMGEEHFVGEYGIERVKATPMGAVVTSRVETARQMQQPGNGAVKLTVDLGLTVDDEGKIKVMMRNVGQAAHDGAVKTVKQNLGSWSGMLQMDGALA